MEGAGLDYNIIEVRFEEYLECPYCGKHYKKLAGHLVTHELTSEDYWWEFPGADIDCEMTRLKLMLPHREMPHWESWSWEYVLDRAWQWHLRHGDCSLADITKYDLSLVGRIKDSGKTWDEVREGMGLPPAKDPHLSKEQVISALRERHEKGLSLKQPEVAKQPNLKSRIYYFFDTWEEALAAAGVLEARLAEVDAPTGVKPAYKSGEEVISALKKRVRQGMSIINDDLQREDCTLRSSIYRYFGNLQECMREAGLEKALANQKHRAKMMRTKYGTKSEWQSAVRQRHRDGKPLRIATVRKEDLVLYKRALKYYGSWVEGLRSAGLLKAFYKEQPHAGPPKYPSQKAVIRAIRLRKKNGQSLLYDDVVADDFALLSAARKNFEGWKDAREQALGK